MKLTFLTLCAIFLTNISLSQDQSFNEFLQNGKMEFDREYNEQNYKAAIDNLQKAIAIKPNNAEAHYYLGYAYDRFNSHDGRTMIEMTAALTEKASTEFETVIKLNPSYDINMIILDPYSKITSLWGSLAMAYIYAGKSDSAKWAFTQGKER
ncbi:MAG: tetratricopeptide repeat protein, partial [Bacteroidetes bacterium]|nr:tetratricopeptide repeat protein [Bacteroidota bacterium]